MVTITRYSDIPGWGDFNQIYKEFISVLPNNATVLELGVGFGRGTWAMLDALQRGITLQVLDSFEKNTPELWDNSLQFGSTLTLSSEDAAQFATLSNTYSHHDIFLYSVNQHNNISQLTTVHSISSELYIENNNTAAFGLVFLDADHSYESVKQQLNYFKDCSLLTGHDYGSNGCPDVKLAVDDFLLENPTKLLHVYTDIEVFVIYNDAVGWDYRHI